MHSACPHDCPSACALVVTVADGRLTGVTGDPTHPFTQGVICGKVLPELLVQPVTDMGGGPAFHSNLVEVAPAQA